MVNAVGGSTPSNAIIEAIDIRRIWKFLLFGLIFHLIFIMSIFDIYFRSPLLLNLPTVQPTHKPLSKRLVLFVGDGLRADKCFEMKNNKKDELTPRAPFLHSIAREKGVWGISHTHVPTESRPGHVAMIAGFYEDVSAVTKGWKRNPVHFDHVLKRAKYAWSFGAPEIVELFKGDSVKFSHFSEEMIDFAKNAIELDQWSFDKLKELFNEAKEEGNVALKNKLTSEGIVIFVHLLGLDTNGHAHRPHSPEYLENVSFVDAGVKEAVRMIEEFYENDGLTSFIFTSDHGMSDAGTHGDGDPDNTRCPLIAWGAGLDTPIKVQNNNNYGDEEWSGGFKLDSVKRRDIQQADLTPLMATLIGIPIPTNSIGTLPVEYLKDQQSMGSRALLTNLEQISVTLREKEVLRASKEPFFRPFHHPISQINANIEEIKGLIETGEYEEAIKETRLTMKLVFEGLEYYQKYDWLLLRTVVALGYIGWIIYGLCYLMDSSSDHRSSKSKNQQCNVFSMIVFGGLLVTTFSLLKAKHSPPQFYPYFFFPLLFFYLIYQKLTTTLRSSLLLSMISSNKRSIGLFILYILAMEMLVYSFFNRSFLSLLIPSLSYGLLRMLPNMEGILPRLLILPLFSSVSLFPSLEPIKVGNQFILQCGVLTLAVSRYLLTLRPYARSVCQLLFVLIAGLIVYQADKLFAAKQGLPLSLQIGAWTVLLASLLSPLWIINRRSSLPIRIADIFYGIAPAYIILSISYEPLFYAAYGLPFIIWSRYYPSDSKSESTTSAQILFLSFKLVTFIMLAFFGTGNFASISSFALPSVYRLITRFSPFIMSTLLLTKLILPIIVLSSSYGMVLRQLRVSATFIFLLVIATIDVMTLSFFFLVRDHGSWLEIGTSISHFILASLFSLATLLVLLLSPLLLSNTTNTR